MVLKMAGVVSRFIFELNLKYDKQRKIFFSKKNLQTFLEMIFIFMKKKLSSGFRRILTVAFDRLF